MTDAFPPPPTRLSRLKARARWAKEEVYTLALACRDPRTPWYARVLAAAVVAYAFSPLDLIPDFIPVIGYLDDLILVPLGILAVRRLIPPAVLAEHRAEAVAWQAGGKPTSRAGAAAIVVIWLLAAVLVGRTAIELWR